MSNGKKPPSKPPPVRPADDSGPTTERPPLDANKPRTEHVLVVDDDADIREIIAEELAEEGYNVRTGADGIEALIKAVRTSVLPDLLILDVGLPFLTGPSVKACLDTEMELRGLPPIPILFITGGDPKLLHPEVRRDYVFTKPFDIEALKDEARRRIHERRLLLRNRRPF
ncbi:MAG: response regulator [Polyangiaceae bacterium]